MILKIKVLMFLEIIKQFSEGKAYNDGEHKLMKYLFSSKHHMDIRPVRNRSRPLNLQFGIAYVQLADLNDAEQVLTSAIWVRQKWINEFVTWNPLNYDNVTEINVEPKKVWVPDITLYNNAVKGIYAGTLYNFKTKVKLRYNGENTWYAPAIIKSSCPINIAYFPFDYQFCPLEFGSWAYNGLELDLSLDNMKADLEFYAESSDFELRAAPAIKKINYFACCPEPYPILKYTIAISRIPGFHFFHVIIPSLYMTFLTLLSFVSPHMIGERVVLTIESFLTLTFSLLLVSEKMPVNSDFTPLINKLILSCMCFQTAIMFCNILTAQISGNKNVPMVVRIVCFKYLAPYIGLREFEYLSTQQIAEHSTDQKMLMLKSFYYEMSAEENRQLRTVINLQSLTKSMQHKKQIEINRQFWKAFTKTLDRLCLFVFTSIYILTTVSIYLNAHRNRLLTW